VGSPSTLALDGTARLNNLAISDLAFATPLTGPVSFSQADGELNIDLREPSQLATGDRIFVSTQAGDRDLVFEVRSGESLAEGYTQGDTFLAEIRQLPLDRLRLPQVGLEGIGMVSGTIESATIAGNWREPSLRASFDIVDPGLGYISLRTTDAPPTPLDPTVPFDPTQPLTETIRYGRLRGTLGYANNIVSLMGVRVESATEQSRYMLSGTYALDGSRQLNGELVVDNGEIQDILLTLKIFELSDFRFNLLQPPEWYRPVTAAEIAALQTNQVGDRNATLLDQLRRFAEVQELQDILAAEADAALLPPLEGLEGRFSGTVTARGALPQDLQVDVDLVGANWVWRDPDHPTGIAYRLEEIIAQGSYYDEVIRLNPVQLRSTFPTADPNAPTLAVAELNGEFSLNEDDPIDRTLRLNITDLPIEAVRRPLRIPNNFDGYINAAAALTGTLNDPQVRGRLGVNNAAINGQPIDLAAADFLYREARLNLRGNVAIEDQVDPLTLLATIPLPLAGSDQIPASDEVTVRLRVRDDGFALINLFTQAVAWETGQAEMAINVDGRWPIDKPFEEALTSLIVTGAARFDDVTISSRNLPEPLTNIQGDIVVVEGRGNGGNDSVYFNGLVLDFQNLTGNFSDGQVLAEGQLKIVPSINDLFPGVGFEAQTPPLTTEADPSPLTPRDDRFRLSLDNIALDLRNPAGTYNGRLDGVVVVGGSLYLLEPLLYGDIRLSNGVITLPETREDNGFAGGGGFNSASPSVYQPLPPVLEDFTVTLADNVRLAIPGLVNVTAEGTLALVGTVPDIRPDGRINLPAGRINLLTTEFRLTGNENYAEFSALDERIDPYLVANLSAAVSDTVGGSTNLITASPFPRNEISDATINQLGLTQGGIQTVRIRASVDGRASRVIQLQGVELESTPPRSENEIITLISSEFLTALESTLGSVSGGGDSFQGLIAFAGSALLNRLQDIIGAGLDNTDLRLFSASPAGSQQVDVGAEVGFNFSPNVSVSVQKVFTNITPALFSVRYRINDQFTIRAITSYEQFNENTGAILEFRL
jgi:translocation and assembly module TamB